MCYGLRSQRYRLRRLRVGVRPMRRGLLLLSSPGARAVSSAAPQVVQPSRARPPCSARPTRADVSLRNLRRNFQALSRAAGVPVWSVVKADAYGHGAPAVAAALEGAGSGGLCVSLLEEGVELRQAGIQLPILVMGGAYPGTGSEFVAHRLTPVLSRLDELRRLAEDVSADGSRSLAVHVKVDTGMARLGLCAADVPRAGELLRAHAGLRWVGLMTHLASAGSDPESVRLQLQRFGDARRALNARGLQPQLLHAANTAATLVHAESRLDLVRPGIGLYGFAPGVGAAPQLAEVMRLRTQVIALRTLEQGASVGYGASWTARRQSRVATVAIGYADGLSRALSNRGSMIVRGRRVPIIGRISMDMASLDVTDAPGVDVGDEVVVMGSQRGALGEARVSAQEVADLSHSIVWEVLTAVSRRVPRVYRED